MPVHAALCNLCRLEGLEPQRLRKVESALEWDGRRYPSCRQSRRSDPHPDSYRRLLTTILAPAQGKEAGA